MDNIKQAENKLKQKKSKESKFKKTGAKEIERSFPRAFRQETLGDYGIS